MNYLNSSIIRNVMLSAVVAFVYDASNAAVKITMNANAPTMELFADGSDAPVAVSEPEAKVYTFDTPDGTYTLVGYGSDGTTVAGTMILEIKDGENYEILTPYFRASNTGEDNSLWIPGTDYTYSAEVRAKDGALREITVGRNVKGDYLATLAIKGDTFAPTLVPSEQRAGEGYISTSQSYTLTFNRNLPIAIPKGYGFDLQVPVGATAFVGTKSAHFVPFSAIEPLDTIDNGNTITYKYRIGEKQVFNYRVSMPGKLTYAEKITMPSEFLEAQVTEEMLSIASPTFIDRNMDGNANNVADIFTNCDYTGCLDIPVGSTKQLVTLRNWEIVDTYTNNYFFEPDYHFTVVDESGNPDDSVIEVNESGVINAKKAGTAFVLITYDAISAPGQVGGVEADKTTIRPFSAIWPENTGVVVVNVGRQESAIQPNMWIHKGLNNVADRTAGDNIDAELDVIYFTGDYAEYTFTPLNAESVTMASPVIGANAASYDGFAADNVVKNADGSYTLRLSEGRNIVKLSDATTCLYQVIRAHKCSYTINNATNEGALIKPGDKVTVLIDGIFHPCNKLAGVYNMSASTVYTDAAGSTLSSKGNQYAFASADAARTVTVTVPEDWDTAEDFTITDGMIKCGGWGDPYGGHREITYTIGKNPNFTAVQHTAFFGKLPDIKIYNGVETLPDGAVLLTFEDADFKGNLDKIAYKTEGMTTQNYWSSLVDSKQYNGPLLYPNNYDIEPDDVYSWYDQNNTGLMCRLNNAYGDGNYWSGGAAVSNYVSGDFREAGYLRQLEAYNPDGGKGGHNGSDHFIVCNGYYDGSSYGTDSRVTVTFADGDGIGQMLHAYINLGCYGLNSCYYGDGFSSAIKDGDYVDVTAEAFDIDNNPIATSTIRLIDGTDKVVKEWTKWDLSELGRCHSVRFNVTSNLANDYGMTFPAYFLLDDIAVIKPSTSDIQDIVAPEAKPTGIYTLQGVRLDRITAPGLYIINGKKVYVNK